MALIITIGLIALGFLLLAMIVGIAILIHHQSITHTKAEDRELKLRANALRIGRFLKIPARVHKALLEQGKKAFVYTEKFDTPFERWINHLTEVSTTHQTPPLITDDNRERLLADFRILLADEAIGVDDDDLEIDFVQGSNLLGQKLFAEDETALTQLHAASSDYLFTTDADDFEELARKMGLKVQELEERLKQAKETLPKHHH